MKPSLRRIRLSCIISIFLCGAFSAEAQTAAGADPLEEALRWERIVYTSPEPDEVHAALQAKAACYARAGLYEEAVSTLERIRMYLLDPSRTAGVLADKARYSLAAGDAAAALGYLEESGTTDADPALYAVLLARAGRWTEAQETALRCCTSDTQRKAVGELFAGTPRTRTEGMAAFLSFFPPAGQLYLGKPGEGFLSMGLHAGAAGFTVWQLLGRHWISGFLGGGLLLSETFLERNLARNVEGVEAANAAAAERFAARLEELLATF